MEVALPQASFLQFPKNLLMGILRSYLHDLAPSIRFDSLGRATLIDHLCKVKIIIGLYNQQGIVMSIEDAGCSAREFVDIG